MRVSPSLKSSLKEKVEPWLTILFNFILPPRILINFFTMVRPRPVPPYFRLTSIEAWEKLSKTVVNLSSGIPIPVSVIWKYRVASLSFKFSRLPA